MANRCIKEKMSQDLIESLVPKNATQSKAFSLFLTSFLGHFPKNYFTKLSKNDFINQIQSIWDQFNSKDTLEPVIDIHESYVSYKKTSRLFITIISPNLPHLIDSLETLLSKWGLKPEIFIHPVVNVYRSASGKVERMERGIAPNHDKDDKKPKISGFDSSGSQESIIFIQTRSRLLANEIEELEQQTRDVLKQLTWVNSDKKDLLESLSGIRDHLKLCHSSRWSEDQIQEAHDFLEWIEGRYFIFLGSRYFVAHTAPTENSVPPQSGEDFFCLEVDEHSENGVFRDAHTKEADDLVPFISRAQIVPHTILDAGVSLLINESPKNKTSLMPPEILPLVKVLKTNQRSNIHRPSRIDSIEVLDWGQDGKIKGVFQFIGIFTKDIFSLSSFEIPLIRHKAQVVFDQFEFDPAWHDGQIIMRIMDSIPRDEMFYLSKEKLYGICSEVFSMRDGGGVSLFLRADPYGRYQTVMVFLSREKYNQQLKDSFGEILAQQLGGSVASEVVQLGDLPFARIIYVIEFDTPYFAKANIEELESMLEEASLTWLDRLERYIDESSNEPDATAVIHKFRKSFPIAYQEQFDSEETYDDICYLNKLNIHHPIEINMYFQKAKSMGSVGNSPKEKEHIISIQGTLRIKIYHLKESLLLSDLLPILSNMGIKVLSETTYSVKMSDRNTYIHDFEVSIKPDIKWLSHLELFRTSFLEIWQGKTENDGFNQLTLGAGLSSRQVNMVRAYIKYLLQARLPYSQVYVESALAHYPRICQHLVELFESRFQVDGSKLRAQEIIVGEILQDLNLVVLLDHDRIIRRLLNVIQSTLRTNYFQIDTTQTGEYGPKSYLSFKFDSHLLADLPSPLPLYEVFVYSSRVEAVHLRGGKVARGGIRWSDRVEDYRTEVLGLMKAQMVKNSVIIPVGSKGGFIVKRQHQLTERSEVLTEAIYCYQIFMKGLLDITDNLVNGHIVPPPQVVRYDNDDPYLVVAADKGTASFSDIANGISKEYKFWLDDAFASGGSAGYDHKKMAITSRGAWESVKRHFREMGTDIQLEPFTVAGVGDMSGDVFGNGMLRSDKICLVFAFDHRHIIIDPHPNPRHSFLERKRLFELPRSSWADYNKDILSKGGGIYNRSEKLIHLSPEAQNLLNLDFANNTPDDVVRAILKVQVDLLWFGGIGTFVKGSMESNSDVGDMVNAAVRIDGKNIRARVVGEGANLAMTQKARIEFALEGGRINTDAIDNSGGVDCSDHEVNIKILFSSMDTPPERSSRNEMLTSMTDDVAQSVLQNNYDQTKVLSIMQVMGNENINIYQDLIKILETDIKLNRSLEFLPDEETFERRRTKGQGMTRPELAVILAYSKLALVRELLASPLVNDSNYEHILITYFPALIQEKYPEIILKHPLRREILGTLMANALINRVGPTFVYELCQVSGCTPAEVIRGFFLAIELLELEKAWHDIDSLDSMMITEIQINAYIDISRSIRIAVLRILGTSLRLSQEGIVSLTAQLSELIEGKDKQRVAREMYTLQERGVPFQVIEKLVVLPYIGSILNIGVIDMDGIPPLEVSKIYFRVRSYFNLDLLESKAFGLETKADWQRRAQLGLLDDIGQIIIALTQNVVSTGSAGDVEGWLKSQEDYLKHIQSLLSQLKSTSVPDIGILTYAIRQLQRMPQVKRVLCSI